MLDGVHKRATGDTPAPQWPKPNTIHVKGKTRSPVRGGKSSAGDEVPGLDDFVHGSIHELMDQLPQGGPAAEAAMANLRQIQGDYELTDGDMMVLAGSESIVGFVCLRTFSFRRSCWNSTGSFTATVPWNHNHAFRG